MKDITFQVQSVQFLSEDAFALRLRAKEDLPEMRAGQFVHLKVSNHRGLFLRRPFCLYQYDKREITLAIAIVGVGTRSLSALRFGDEVQGILPIGNGFVLSERHKKIALIGGGLGCAPLYMVPKTAAPECEVRAFLGFANEHSVLFEREFKETCAHTTVATDDGSYGFNGYVTDAFTESCKDGFKPDVILTCGSLPMLKAVAKLSLKTGIPAYSSGEAHMGCGVGACLVCTCAVKGKDGAVHNKRACVDGPVFLLEDLVL